MSGFAACDKIIPVVTLIMYFGAKDWEAPRSLYDMFDDVDDNIKKLVSDYRINILVPKEIKNTEKFNTDLRYVIDFIKASEDKNELKKLVEEKKNTFEEMSQSAAMVLRECTSVKIETNGKDKVVDMCKAIEDMMEDARKEEREKNIEEINRVKEETSRAKKEATNLCDEREKAILNMLNKLTPEDIIGFGYDRDIVMKLAEK